MNEKRQLLFNLLAGAIVLLAPPISLLLYHDYPLLHAESLGYLLPWALAGGLGGLLAHLSGRSVASLLWASLLILSFDLQFQFLEYRFPLAATGIWLVLILAGMRLGENAPKIILAGYAGIVGTSLLLGPEQAEVLEERDLTTHHDAGNPIVLHLVLDGYLGPPAIPQDIPGGTELRREVRFLFDKYGFRVFENAFSESIETHRSLASIFNNAAEPDRFLRKVNGDWRISTNEYLEEMGMRGYRLHVRQSSFLDICAGVHRGLASCRTSRYDRLRHAMDEDLRITDYLVLFLSFQVAHSEIYRYLQRTAALLLRAGSEGVYSSVDEARIRQLYDWRQSRIWSLSQSEIFDKLYREIIDSPGGELFFVHHMKPHGPYAYDRDCSVRRVSEWTNRRYRWSNEGSNDEGSRRHRYLQYFEQVRCVNRQLADLFEQLQAGGLLADMLILVHGDHGSRIFLFPPAKNQAKKMTPRDHLDAFSTLFAARVPGRPAARHDRTAPLKQLLWDTISPQHGQTNDPACDDKIPSVWIWHKGRYERTPYLGQGRGNCVPDIVSQEPAGHALETE
jgi:hypothetical protein